MYSPRNNIFLCLQITHLNIIESINCNRTSGARRKNMMTRVTAQYYDDDIVMCRKGVFMTENPHISLPLI